MNLLGNGIRSFIDGPFIAAGLPTSFTLGLMTTIAVALHEIPQEVGDMGMLIYVGLR